MSNDNETTETLPKNFRYRDENGKMISLEEAKERRLAYKDTGLPTKIYKLRQAKREAEKNGESVPVRSKKTYEPGSQNHAGVPSPYDLERRSGYRTIWQVLAENVGEFVTVEALTDEVIKRLKAEAPEWYDSRYTDEEPYDVEANAYVMTRKPYNQKIEAMNQRVVKEDEGFKLMTDVTEPRKLKKRGRKPKNATPELDANVETDNDDAQAVIENEPAEATA